MRVLYVNHTAEVSGAEHSLLSLLAGLPPQVRPRVAAPRGRLLAEVQRLGIPTTAIAGTAGSLRLHPLHTPRALVEMALAAAQVRRAARTHHADVVHANSIRAGIVVGLAWPRGAGGRRPSTAHREPAPARVAHVRDCLPPGPVSAATLRLIAATASTVIANSRHTAQSVRAAAPGAALEVVHNPLDLARWDAARLDPGAARRRLGAAGEPTLLLGVVAQLSPWKGHDTAIEALRLVCAAGVDAQLLLIGSAKFRARATRYDNESYVASLRAQVAAARLDDRVWWLGERDDVPALLSALDILLLPSWEEPFGRALIEAMALEVPVIATAVGGPPEILTDGCEGLLAPPRQPKAWAQAIEALASDPERRRAMGEAGRRRVQEAFTTARHVAAVCGVYGRAAGPLL
ncbi:MAG TPA: glycosyltransferase family 4 protein [Solirubrobacteraceae bacterium]|jgi:glycosyltransferase involved in cell wall biosynthesis|nr:glycosyltransferase family 4 protein [Solirubrobacteraceae bacterium]